MCVYGDTKKTFIASFKVKQALKSLILKETIDGKEIDVQYFPVAGESLSPDITFYDIDGQPLDRTGDDGKYLQEDLKGTTLVGENKKQSRFIQHHMMILKLHIQSQHTMVLV